MVGFGKKEEEGETWGGAVQGVMGRERFWMRVRWGRFIVPQEATEIPSGLE